MTALEGTQGANRTNRTPTKDFGMGINGSGKAVPTGVSLRCALF